MTVHPLRTAHTSPAAATLTGMRIFTRTVYEIDLMTSEEAGNIGATASDYDMNLETFVNDQGNRSFRLTRPGTFTKAELATRLHIEAAIRGMTPRQIAEEALDAVGGSDEIPLRLAYPNDEPDEDLARDR